MMAVYVQWHRWVLFHKKDETEIIVSLFHKLVVSTVGME